MKCQWFIGRDLRTCVRNRTNDNYCRIHQYVLNYSEEEKQKYSFCSGCRKVKHIKDNFRSCIGCRNKTKGIKKPKKEKRKRKIVKDIMVENIEIDEEDSKIIKKVFQKRKRKASIKKPKKIKCKGYRGQKIKGQLKIKSCGKYAGDEEIFCKFHLYLKDMSEEELKKIENSEMDICMRCKHFVKKLETKRECLKCTDSRKQYGKKKKRKLLDKKCEWLNRHDKRCVFKKINDTNYCKNHQYVNNYTQEMKDNSKKCVGCVKYKYFENFNTCNECRKRSSKNRIIEINKKIICKLCKFKALKNGYCGNHQLQYWKMNIEKDSTKKVCKNYIRGCRKILNIDKEYSLCRQCRYKKNIKNSYNTYKKSARRRNLEFNIEKETFDKLKNQLCHYCNEMNEKGENGLDRINNNIGYKEKNVVPCCSVCNFMKQKMEIKRFIKCCKNINENMGLNKINKSLNKKYIKLRYKKYIYRGKTKNIPFKISYEEFERIMNSTCYYCNDTNMNNKPGIDRIDSNQGYSLDNIVPCCKECNYIKFTYPLELFESKINKISKNFG